MVVVRGYDAILGVWFEVLVYLALEVCYNMILSPARALYRIQFRLEDRSEQPNVCHSCPTGVEQLHGLRKPDLNFGSVRTFESTTRFVGARSGAVGSRSCGSSLCAL